MLGWLPLCFWIFQPVKNVVRAETSVSHEDATSVENGGWAEFPSLAPPVFDEHMAYHYHEAIWCVSIRNTGGLTCRVWTVQPLPVPLWIYLFARFIQNILILKFKFGLDVEEADLPGWQYTLLLTMFLWVIHFIFSYDPVHENFNFISCKRSFENFPHLIHIAPIFSNKKK